MFYVLSELYNKHIFFFRFYLSKGFKFDYDFQLMRNQLITPKERI
jgi:hypothetical protein